MKDVVAEVLNNRMIAPDAYLLEVSLPSGATADVRGGQFAMLEVPRADCILRRPLGICMAGEEYAAFLYQVKGGGTQALTTLEAGDELNISLPLGNGFPDVGSNVAIVGGGFGVVPLMPTAVQCGGNARLYLGFADKKHVMLKKEFASVGKLTLCTDDGSEGFRGFPTQALERDLAEGFAPDAILCCGPEPLMRAVKALGESRGIPTYLSLEARMGCGVGACLTCTCKADGHNKRVCKDGPVFRSSEVYN